jgi:hypothetical protein
MCCLCMLPCYLQGTEEQKAHLLPGMSDNSLVGCWALTEPSNGSDASALTCTATKVRGCCCVVCVLFFCLGGGGGLGGGSNGSDASALTCTATKVSLLFCSVCFVCVSWWRVCVCVFRGGEEGTGWGQQRQQRQQRQRRISARLHSHQSDAGAVVVRVPLFHRSVFALQGLQHVTGCSIELAQHMGSAQHSAALLWPHAQVDVLLGAGCWIRAAVGCTYMHNAAQRCCCLAHMSICCWVLLD